MDIKKNLIKKGGQAVEQPHRAVVEPPPLQGFKRGCGTWGYGLLVALAGLAGLDGLGGIFQPK